MLARCLVLFAFVSSVNYTDADDRIVESRGALDGVRHRVLVSTDIGGTDPDDFQSLVHLFLYADTFDLEGIVSSPFGPGRAEHIHEVIEAYEEDFSNLRSYSDLYPEPDALRLLVKQGETKRAPFEGVRESTEGSDWIVKCARKQDTRPLHVLVWGGLEDVAQALHTAPDILPMLRVYWIGGPNKKWGADAYQYIADSHPELWIIENNSTYRGWFVGGVQMGDWSNKDFVSRHVASSGAMGRLFANKKDEIKMGDSPSLAWILKGDPSYPQKNGWGGRFVKVWDKPMVRMEKMPTKSDTIEVFSILELGLPTGGGCSPGKEAVLLVDNQRLSGFDSGDGFVRWRFSPKSVKQYDFRIVSDCSDLDGLFGGITAVSPEEGAETIPSSSVSNWWTDSTLDRYDESGHDGARLISQWRKAFLVDFASRLWRLEHPSEGGKTQAERARWSKAYLKRGDLWYASSGAVEIADTVLMYQSKRGGWPKNTDLTVAPEIEERIPGKSREIADTIDNDATTLPMRYLAKVAFASEEARFVESFERGLQYLFDAQYSNGGWPQYWPLRGDKYYSRITFNDSAMIQVMELLRDVSEGGGYYEFVDDSLRSRASEALELGIECILKTQIRQKGKLAGWCAQHDEKTFEPAWARAYEPPSLSGGETVGIVRFLMSIEEPSDEVVAAVEGAVAWLRLVEMKGVRLVSVKRDDGRTERWLENDPNASGLWARFYELETNRPLYLDRDSVFRYDFSEIGYERRSGYSYHGTWPASLIEKYYPRWKRRLAGD